MFLIRYRHGPVSSNVTVKATDQACMTEPPADWRDSMSRWARPLEFSDESNAGSASLRRWPAADGFELLYPARCVFLRAHRCVVDTLVDIGLASAEHQVDQPDHFVRHRDDGFLVRLAHHQAAVLGRQGALGHSSCVGALAQDEANDRVAVPGAARLALASTLVVAWAQGGPAGQALGAPEAGHVVANLDQDQCGRNLVDARDGLQQLMRPGVGLHGVEQVDR